MAAKAALTGRTGRGLLAALALTLLVAPAAAEEGATRGELVDARSRAEAEAAQSRRAAEEARLAAAEIAAERARIKQRIAELGARIVAREEALAAASARLDALRIEVVGAQARLETAQERLATLTDTLQRIAREPTPALLAQPDRPRATARKLVLVRAYMREFDAARDGARRELAAIAAAKEEARRVEAASLAERDLLRREIAEAETLLEQKRAAEAEHIRRADAADREADRLAERAQNLGELAASLAASEQASAMRERAEEPFESAKGRLLRPVGGPLRSRPRADGGVGAVFVSRPFARVIAPWSGVVRFAGTFKSGEAGVIIEPETGYSILLAGLGRVMARENEYVEAGQVIGLMDGPRAASDGPEFETGLTAEMLREREELTIGVYKASKHIDPSPWFRADMREVSGL